MHQRVVRWRIENAEASTHGRLMTSANVPREADARREIVRVGTDRIAQVIELISDAGFQRQIREKPAAIFEISCDVRLGGCDCRIAECLLEALRKAKIESLNGCKRR